jgi:hypothetical protein
MDYCSQWQEEKREQDHASPPGYSISFPVPENGHSPCECFLQAV